jgi:hypothetical protein
MRHRAEALKERRFLFHMKTVLFQNLTADILKGNPKTFTLIIDKNTEKLK